MIGIESAHTGTRQIVYGEFKPKPGQRVSCLRLIERGLIRYCVAHGYDLVNKQGTVIKKHSLKSERTGIVRNLIPAEIPFEPPNRLIVLISAKYS